MRFFKAFSPVENVAQRSCDGCGDFSFALGYLSLICHLRDTFTQGKALKPFRQTFDLLPSLFGTTIKIILTFLPREQSPSAFFRKFMIIYKSLIILIWMLIETSYISTVFIVLYN